MIFLLKVERSKRYEEEIIRILSPRPPTGARGVRKQHSGPEGEHSESSESVSQNIWCMLPLNMLVTHEVPAKIFQVLIHLLGPLFKC